MKEGIVLNKSYLKCVDRPWVYTLSDRRDIVECGPRKGLGEVGNRNDV